MLSTDRILDPGSRTELIQLQLGRLSEAVDAAHPGPRDRFLKLVLQAYARGVVDAFAAECHDPMLALLAARTPELTPNLLERVQLARFRVAGAVDMQDAMTRPSEVAKFPTLIAWLDSRRGQRH